jgi:D-serine deaminase-like pyridoxal phosphate-dependent protein
VRGVQRLRTPALLLDRDVLAANLERMRRHTERLGVGLRPHLKTAKSVDVATMAVGHNGPITVSTLAEAEHFAAHGFTDIVYAVGITPAKLPAAAALRRRGIDLQVILDSVEMAGVAAGAAEHLGGSLAVWIEVDVDGLRSGIPPDSPALLEVAGVLGAAPGVRLAGVLSHGGGSYRCRGVDALAAFAESERAGVVAAAEAIRAAGIDCPGVSMGSSPGVAAARSLDGITEVRPGVYMFQDLFQAGLGVCDLDDIAVSVLTSVIGRSRDGLVLDAGGLALSLDRSTAALPDDSGFGRVCDASGRLLPGWTVERVTQEHGIVTSSGDPIGSTQTGTLLRVLPNHACMTAAAHDRYHVLSGGRVVAQWPRCNGW